MRKLDFIKVFSAAIVIATSALAQGSVWNGTANTSWYSASQSNFTITTAEELAGLAQLVNNGNNFSGKTVKLDNDVDLDDRNWTPVGSFSKQFKGTFDGGKHCVQNVAVSNAVIDASRNEGYAGFFGYVGEVGQIKNVVVNVTGMTISANTDYVFGGGLTGYYNSTKAIENCGVNISGGISVSAQMAAYSGGLVGYGETITISNSFSKGNVSSSAPYSYAGGLAGYGYNITVANSFSNAGNVSSSGQYSYSGGLVGYAEFFSALTNCYAILTITATGSGEKYAGGIFGQYSSGTNTSVYYSTAGANKAAGYGTPTGITGLSLLTQLKNQTTFSGWDFVNVWRIDASVNDGYPYLRLFHPEKEPNPNGVRSFPQAGKFETSALVIKPNLTQQELNDDVLEKYASYRNAYLKSVQATDGIRYYIQATGEGEGGDTAETISEAHGYGMIIFALMAGTNGDEKTIFDGMNRLRKAHRSRYSANLMSWVVYQPAQNPTPCSDCSAATDGDLDNAYALLLAYEQWGDVSYLNDAKTLIAAIKQWEMSTISRRTKLGDWQTEYAQDMNMPELNTRSSDWMPGHFRAFYKATEDNFWLQSADTVYSLLSQVSNPVTGLIPDFVTGQKPAIPDPNGGYTNEKNAQYYYYNACRDPWRLATDYAHHGTSAAKAQIDKISSWLKGKTGGNPENIMAGYKLDGAALTDEGDMAFIAPFASGMIANPSNREFLNSTYEAMKVESDNEYSAAIQLLNMLLISGNWWAPYSVQIPEPEPPVSIFGGADKTAKSIGFAGIINGQINLNLKAGNYTLQLYNLQGRLVKSADINATNGINATGLKINNLSKGIFILNVKQAGVSVLKQKIAVK